MRDLPGCVLITRAISDHVPELRWEPLCVRKEMWVGMLQLAAIGTAALILGTPPVWPVIGWGGLACGRTHICSEAEKGGERGASRVQHQSQQHADSPRWLACRAHSSRGDGCDRRHAVSRWRGQSVPQHQWRAVECGNECVQHAIATRLRQGAAHTQGHAARCSTGRHSSPAARRAQRPAVAEGDSVCS